MILSLADFRVSESNAPTVSRPSRDCLSWQRVERGFNGPRMTFRHPAVSAASATLLPTLAHERTRPCRSVCSVCYGPDERPVERLEEVLGG